MRDEPRRGPVRWARSISVASRLAASVVAVSVVSLVVATLVGIGAGRDLTDELTDDRLSALRTSAATDVEAQMRSAVRTARTVASSPEIARVTDRFGEALSELESADPAVVDRDIDELVAQYDEQFLVPFSEAGIDAQRRDLIDPEEVASVRLQAAYSLPDEPGTPPSAIDDAGDGSEWSSIHRDVHPILRDVVERQELVDLLLVDPADGTVVYSVAKHPDLGTSLDVGPFSGTVIAGAVDAVRADPGAGPVITDVSTYLPAGLEPVGAIASPVLEGDELVAIVVLLYDSTPFTDLLTADGEWEAAGFPPTGEAFMIAGDGTMRSEPRSFLEDPGAHLEGAEETGSIDEDGRARIAVSGTTVLTERAADQTVNAARSGDERIRERATVLGEAAFSTTAPVAVDGVEWYVVSEVNREESRGPLEDFARRLIVGAAIFVVLVAFAAVAWSSSMLASIRQMSERLRTWRSSTEPVVVPERGPLEIERLASSFTEMLDALETQRTDLEAARTRKVDLLRSMLPPQVAERVASGDLETIEEVPKVSVAVLVVAGLGDLVRIENDDANRALFDRLTAELDELGERHGLERIKIVGDAYYAVCGHSRPYIDHAPRALSFAADAQDAVREQGEETEHGLDVVVGIHTGPVNVGMTRATGLVYDVWGPTVSVAHGLARIGHRGQILVTDATRALLPDTVATTAFPGEESVSVVSTATVGGIV